MPTATDETRDQEVKKGSQSAPNHGEKPRRQTDPIRWICGGVIVASVLACVILAALRSISLTQITVTALDQASEPRDHTLPFVKKKEALPDYELTLILAQGGKIRLGSKPDQSASQGLIWYVADPVSTADIASVRLREKDMVLSDSIAEVHVASEPFTSNGYRFEFVTQTSVSVGIKSFFGTPIGQAIVIGFGLAVMIVVLRVFM